MLTANDLIRIKVTRSKLSECIRSFFPLNDHYSDVIWWIDEFNNAFEVKENIPLYIDLLAEEVYEFMEQLVVQGARSNLLKEAVDVCYILEGMIAMCPDEELPDNIDHDRLDLILDLISEKVVPISKALFDTNTIYEGFKEVHTSNMSKIDRTTGLVIRREDGKVLKGPDYTPAHIDELYSGSQMLLRIKERLS